MDLPDVNVLIYAFRPETKRHSRSRAWLEGVVGSGARFAISPLSLSAMARIVTNSRVYDAPSSLEDAFAFADSLLDLPHCEVVEPGERHWSIFKRLCVETGVRGPLLSDVWYAALALEHGCRFITFDRDFARFPGLDCREPA